MQHKNTINDTSIRKISPKIIQVYDSSNLIKTLSNILDYQNLEILQTEIFSSIFKIIRSENKEENISETQLVFNMHEFLTDCRVEIEYHILSEFINKLINLCRKEEK